VNPEQIAARVWPGRPVALEPLGGGITNRNFKVAVDGDAFVLRIGGKDTELLGIDRQAEYEASLAAASLGIGPEVVAFLEREGCLVTRFIPGAPVDVRASGVLRQAGTTLRRLHEGPALHARFDAFRVVEAYRATAADRGVAIPPVYDWAKELADEIERRRERPPLRPCHNDLLNANLIHDGERLRIVDWEYAGMGDRFFDLANFAVNHELADEEQRELLTAYFGQAHEADVGALHLMRFMSDFREAMWGVVQQGISELDFDFVAYADEHFERLRRTAAEPGFVRARETLAR
jgi:thiamine kinase-like enzyme